MTLEVAPVGCEDELRQILELQRENHVTSVSPERARAEGFVTARHTLASLSEMHALAPSIVAKAEGRVVGYALTMLREARACVPLLDPMFEALDSLSWRGRPLPELRHYVMGQICVAREQRGQGVFDALYHGHRQRYADSYDLIVTEIATRNGRSLRAHGRVGFEPLHRHGDSVDDWLIVAWDFQPRTGPTRA